MRLFINSNLIPPYANFSEVEEDLKSKVNLNADVPQSA